MPSKVVPAIVGFVSIPLLTNLFAPDAYGDYRLALAAVVLIGTAAGWLPSSILRFFPAHDNKGNLGAFYANLTRFWAVSTLTLSGIWVFVSLLLGNRSVIACTNTSGFPWLY